MADVMDFLENKDIREASISRVEVLDKVGGLLLLPNIGYATIEQVSAYYEVNIDTISKLATRNSDELESDGYSSFKKNDIVELLKGHIEGIEDMVGKSVVTLTNMDKIDVPNRGLRLFSKQAILRVAFYLTDSSIARRVRKELLLSCPEAYYSYSQADQIRYKKYEKDMEYFLIELFGEDSIQTQVKCGSYYLDFIIDDTVHIEVNEYGHHGYSKKQEIERANYILENTEYYSFNFNPQKDSKFSLIYNIFNLYEHIGMPCNKELLLESMMQ